MSIERYDGVPVVDPWVDAASVIAILDDSVAKLEHKFDKAYGNFDSLSDYASNALFVRDLSSLTYIGEDAFCALARNDIQEEKFTQENAEFAIQGYKIALRACLQLSKARRSNGSVMQFFPQMLAMQMREMYLGDTAEMSPAALLGCNVSKFLYEFMPEPPENLELVIMDNNGDSFSNRWAYKLGYLQPMNTAFQLMIVPETYFDLVDAPEKWHGVVEPGTLDYILDVSSLPVVEDS